MTTRSPAPKRRQTATATTAAASSPLPVTATAEPSSMIKPNGAGAAGKPDTIAAGAKKKVKSRSKDVDSSSLATKLVRDRFSMPADDYDLIKLLKQRAANGGRPAKKNELLRAGLHALRESGSVELVKSLQRLTPVTRKNGKPSKEK